MSGIRRSRPVESGAVSMSDLREAATLPAIPARLQVRGVAGPATLALYTACISASAFMLFLVEPMVAKMLLPLVGGAPAVWTAAVLFFQAGLLAGYGYAHGLARRLSSRRQACVHLAVMLLPLLVLPISVPTGWTLPAGASPVLSILSLLALIVGLPFFVVSAGSPLLQRWFASSGHPHAADPYFLYRASNLGSFAALVVYPVLIEPHLGLLAQSRAWAAGYVVLALLTGACTLVLWRRAAGDHFVENSAPAVAPARPTRPIAAARRSRWVLLAAVPSLWMLAVTTYFTSIIRPMPLLWVIPLALYLLSLAIVFARRPVISQRLLVRAFPFLALPLLAMILLQGAGPFWLLAGLHFGTFFVGALICHGELARDRPGREALTEFYLWLAIGGAIGGALAIAAPFVFSDLAEYPLVVVGACFLRPALDREKGTRARLLDLLLPIGMAALLLLPLAALALTGILDRLNRTPLTAVAQASDLVRVLVVFAVPAVACVAFSHRNIRFGLGVAMIFLLSFLPLGSQQSILYQTRDFFGVHTVLTDPSGSRHILMDGGTIHGIQLTDLANRDEPSSYYSRQGPLGDLFASLDATDSNARIGVVGLGAGAVACYAKSGQRWTFYEIDPAVEVIARNPRLFTFLRDCAPDNSRVVIGDGRLALAADTRARYDVLIIDAFGGDAPPVHLLTREAIQLYLGRLAPGGVLLFNVSNKYLNLTPVLANVGSDLGLATCQRVDLAGSPSSVAGGIFPSAWIVMTRDGGDLKGLASREGWSLTRTDPSQPVWTDDFSDVLNVTVFR